MRLSTGPDSLTLGGERPKIIQMSRQESVLVHTESSTAWGGQEIRILTELKELGKFGWKVQLWAPASSDLYRRARALSIDAEPVDFRRLADVESLLKVRRLILERKVDLLVTHSSIDSWITGLATRTIFRRPKLVRARHLSTPIRNILSYRWFPDAISTTSAAISRSLACRGIPGGRIHTFPTGVDLKRFRPNVESKTHFRKKYGLPADQPLVGGVFVIRSWKGIYDFVKIVAATPADHFVVAGEGPSRGTMEEAAAKSGVLQRLTFVGHVEAVEEILWALDIFLFPSTANEGVPQALLQAQACGIPAVVSDLPSIREAAPHAVFCRPGDVGSFTLAIQNLLIDPAFAGRVGREGMDWVKAFDQDETMKGLDRFYMGLVQNSQHGS